LWKAFFQSIFAKTSVMKKSILLLMLAISSFSPFAQQNPFPKTITVTGSAEMEIVPDEIYVVIELKEYDKKGAGKIGLEAIKTDFLRLCKQADLPDSVISITAYEGNNPYWLKKRKKKDDLYASISYQIEFNNSKMMDDLVTLLDDDATENFQIVRTYHSKMIEFRRQLKIQAIKAAKEKAGYLAEAINEKAGEAISVKEPVENYSGSYLNRNFLSNISGNALAMDQAEENSQGVDFKKMTLRFEVSVVFALK
jgi:uncharacterized protein